MTDQQTPAAAPAPATAKARNIVGIVAFVAAIVGFIFACVPGALIVGWVILPIAFILGIVGVCLSGKVKWQAVTAIILSIVGTIVGFIVFFTVVAVALSTAIEEGGYIDDEVVVVVEDAE